MIYNDKKEITFVTDRAGSMRTDVSYQLVLKNKDILNYFISTGGIIAEHSEINDKGELVVELIKNSETHFYKVIGQRNSLVVDIFGSDIEVKFTQL